MTDTRQALELAIKFHETYERLAPQFGYETRTETRKFDPESANGRLMIAVCAALSAQPVAGEVAHPSHRNVLIGVRTHLLHWLRSGIDDEAIALIDRALAAPQPQAAPAPEPSAQAVEEAVAQPVAWLCSISHPDWLEVCERDAPGAFPVYATPQAAQAAPASEPSRSQKMREAGFTARDTRLTCDECGAKFTRQFAPLHECAAPEPSARAVPLTDEQITLAWQDQGGIARPGWIYSFARAIERAHGIATKAAQEDN